MMTLALPIRIDRTTARPLRLRQGGVCLSDLIRLALMPSLDLDAGVECGVCAADRGEPCHPESCDARARFAIEQVQEMVSGLTKEALAPILCEVRESELRDDQTLGFFLVWCALEDELREEFRAELF